MFRDRISEDHLLRRQSVGNFELLSVTMRTKGDTL